MNKARASHSGARARNGRTAQRGPSLKPRSEGEKQRGGSLAVFEAEIRGRVGKRAETSRVARSRAERLGTHQRRCEFESNVIVEAIEKRREQVRLLEEELAKHSEALEARIREADKRDREFLERQEEFEREKKKYL